MSPAYWKLAETASKVELLQRIDVLEEENQRLKAEVARLRKDQNREVRTAREKPFGNDTPSSKITFKPDAEVTRIANRGGATKGHEGHGRKRSADAVDETVAVERPQTCDRCGEQLVDFKVEERTVRIAIPPHYRTLRYRTRSGWCESCNRQVSQKVRGGSQSKDALMVREVLQSVIESLRLRCADPVAKLTEALDAYAIDPGICIPDLLFPLPTHKAELSRRRAGTRRV